MFKPKTLLKVMSVLFIISGVLGAVSVIIGAITIPKMGDIEGVDMSLINAAYTPINIALSIASSLCCILAGIFGVSGKSFKGAVITAGIYTVILVVNVIQSVMASGMQFLLILDFILPVLYWWGLYQSKE